MGARVAANNRQTSVFIGFPSCADTDDEKSLSRRNGVGKHGHGSNIPCLPWVRKIGGFGDCGFNAGYNSDDDRKVLPYSVVKGNILQL